jgi:hypothetical protein
MSYTPRKGEPMRLLMARLELALTLLLTVAAVATVIWPTWLETLTRLEPDGGSGEAEWWLVLLLGLAALASAAASRRAYGAARSSSKVA